MKFQDAYKKYIVEDKMYSSMKLDKVKPLSTTKYDLIDAVKTGDYRIVEKLLQNRHTNINMQDDYSGKTPLMIAAEKGLTTIIRLLLSIKDINVNLTDGSGRTALMLAVLNNRPAVVSELVKHKKIDITKKDDNEKTALDLAKELDSTAIVSALETPVQTSDKTTSGEKSKVDTSNTSKLVCTPENKVKYEKALADVAELEKQKADIETTMEALQKEYEANDDTATAKKLIKLLKDKTEKLEKITSLKSLINDMKTCGIDK